MSSTIPHLDAETLEKLAISPAEAVDSIEEAIRNASAGIVQTAPKATMLDCSIGGGASAMTGPA